MLPINNLIVDIWLIIFLLLSVWELNLAKSLPKLKELPTYLPKHLDKYIVASFVFLLVILFSNQTSIFNKLFIYALSTSVLGHTIWISAKYGYKSAALGLLLIALRILWPNELTHNLFVISAIAWLGPIITKYKLMNARRFLIISLIWFIYDIFYVWISSLATQANELANSAGFPMGIISGNALIGNADLFWVGLLLSVIPMRKFQIISILSLLISDFALSIYLSNSPETVIFPLLVLWVPVGILINWRIFLNLKVLKFGK